MRNLLLQDLQTADNEFLHLIEIDIPRTFPVSR